MCGIVGQAGNLTIKTDAVFKTLLILDALRGIDSTGVAAIAKDNTDRIVKGVGDPYCLFDNRRYNEVMSRANHILIGHNRYATQGSVSRKNAHPFEFTELIGVHNGTLKSKHKLLDSRNFDVDSENLYHHMNEKGLDDLCITWKGHGHWSGITGIKTVSTSCVTRNVLFTSVGTRQVMF